MAAAVVVTQIYYDEEPKGFVWANIDEISSTRRSHAFSSEHLPPWEDSIWGFALIWRNTYPRWSGGGYWRGILRTKGDGIDQMMLIIASFHYCFAPPYQNSCYLIL